MISSSVIVVITEKVLADLSVPRLDIAISGSGVLNGVGSVNVMSFVVVGVAENSTRLPDHPDVVNRPAGKRIKISLKLSASPPAPIPSAHPYRMQIPSCSHRKW